MEKNRMLKYHWQQYSTNFIYDIDKKKKTTSDARDYFNEGRVLGGRINFRLWMFIPNVLFLMGICSIFVFLIYGLLLFNDASSPDQIMKNIEPFFMAIAKGFVVLVVSVVLTLLLVFVVRGIRSRLICRVKRLGETLNTVYKITSMEEREIALKEYTVALRDVVREVFVSGQENQSASVGALTGQLVQHAEQQNKLLGAIVNQKGSGNNGATTNLVLDANTKAEIKTIMGSASQVLQKTQEEYATVSRETMEQFSKQFSEAIEPIKELSTQLQRMHAEMENQFAGLTQAINSDRGTPKQ